ncbi:unnamed protein product [Linum trigynum]|uniref:Uncharacterized protein n=1 Tax=Linum trigynum TaxID=586398 RepID=A0AAV2GTB2_9ROSI
MEGRSGGSALASGAIRAEDSRSLATGAIRAQGSTNRIGREQSAPREAQIALEECDPREGKITRSPLEGAI